MPGNVEKKGKKRAPKVEKESRVAQVEMTRPPLENILRTVTERLFWRRFVL
jgi:hypothetical protein